MRKYMLIILLICVGSAMAQVKDMKYDFYGFIRGDLFYNTRKSVAPVDGNFYLYPMDKRSDAEGKDLNGKAMGNFISYTSRLGLNIKGPQLGGAKVSANVEVDFGGAGKVGAVLRLRKAYVACDWDNHRVLIGQTWHPLFGLVVPDMLNLSTGAPFQPFNRSPQICYQLKGKNLTLTASALWQVQYTSNGPSGKSADYLKNSILPEFYLGADWYVAKGFTLGGGAHLISLSPREESVVGNKIYKVNEHMTATSYEVHAMYRSSQWYIAAKSILASALDHTALLGGYGVHNIDATSGKQEYTPFRHSVSWFNIAYGKTWKPSLFVGFTKNMGTRKELESEKSVYGAGLDIDALTDVQLALSYNRHHFQIGLEASICTAWYGDINRSNGKVKHTHDVSNYRVLGLLMYYF